MRGLRVAGPRTNFGSSEWSALVRNVSNPGRLRDATSPRSRERMKPSWGCETPRTAARDSPGGGLTSFGSQRTLTGHVGSRAHIRTNPTEEGSKPRVRSSGSACRAPSHEGSHATLETDSRAEPLRKTLETRPATAEGQEGSGEEPNHPLRDGSMDDQLAGRSGP